MPFGGRVYRLGKLLLLVAALGGTFVLFAGVAMRVALRSREVQVPQLAGRTLTEAARTLAAVGLVINVDDLRRPDTTVPEGRVVQQEPRAGVAARQQRTIRVWLSAGPRITTVGDFVGESERAARLRLEQDGVMVAGVTELHSADYPIGIVVGQDPPASVNAPRVNLLVNRGAGSIGYVMPSLDGLDARRSADALRGLGFRVSLTPSLVAGVGPPGTVVRHTPAPGYQVAPGDAIALEVSR
jgi:beta-lactam-binding protein with PASTA domain